VDAVVEGDSGADAVVVGADAVVEGDSWADAVVEGNSGADSVVVGADTVVESDSWAEVEVESDSGADAVVEKETSGIAVVATFSNHGFLCSVFLSSLPKSLDQSLKQ
jgi:hypothetical protein